LYFEKGVFFFYFLFCGYMTERSSRTDQKKRKRQPWIQGIFLFFYLEEEIDKGNHNNSDGHENRRRVDRVSGA